MATLLKNLNCKVIIALRCTNCPSHSQKSLHGFPLHGLNRTFSKRQPSPGQSQCQLYLYHFQQMLVLLYSNPGDRNLTTFKKLYTIICTKKPKQNKKNQEKVWLLHADAQRNQQNICEYAFLSSSNIFSIGKWKIFC